VLLQAFSVENYRSIRRAQKLQLSDLTVLVGPNNEGKSNIMRAMVMGMRILRLESLGVRRRVAVGNYRSHLNYAYDRDCPVDLQANQKKTTLEFEFRLTDAEQLEFQRITRVRLQTGLRVALTFDSENGVEFKVRKQGPAGNALTAQKAVIAKFIADRLRLEYVSAVRTAQAAQDVVAEMVEERLEELEGSPEYAKALAKVRALQQPALDELATEVERTLRDFLPEVRGVSVSLASDTHRGVIRRSVQITVNDGHATPLESKGDGIQSLAALAMLRQAAERDPGELILAIEEPEAHLHPSAIHELNRVLRQISSRGQVIITTHHPILVGRGVNASNIVVEGSEARRARSIADLRATLGVRTSDNLTNAELLVLVEGESDRRILEAILSTQSVAIRNATSEGFLAFQGMRGASNLAFMLQRAKETLSQQHVVLDNDEAGRDAYQKASSAKLLEPAGVNLLSLQGRADSELEDILEVQLYKPGLEQEFAIRLSGGRWRNSRKWTTRLQDVLRDSGRPCDDSVIHRAKEVVADAVVADPSAAVHAHAANLISSIVSSLESKLGALGFRS
jgi:putative ATP-dependent endonuclease of OLD family